MGYAGTLATCGLDDAMVITRVVTRYQRAVHLIFGQAISVIITTSIGDAMLHAQNTFLVNFVKWACRTELDVAVIMQANAFHAPSVGQERK